MRVYVKNLNMLELALSTPISVLVQENEHCTKKKGSDLIIQALCVLDGLIFVSAQLVILLGVEKSDKNIDHNIVYIHTHTDIHTRMCSSADHSSSQSLPLIPSYRCKMPSGNLFASSARKEVTPSTESKLLIRMRGTLMKKL